MQSFSNSEESLHDAPLPERRPSASQQQASYLAYPIKHTFSSVLRRVSSDHHVKRSAASSATTLSALETSNGLYTPPRGPTPPFNPPPLSPLLLKGHGLDTPASAQLLTSLLGEEIRLLFPARLQLCESWNLAFSLDRDGASLSTLYHKCDEFSGTRAGYVLVVKDASGSVFGAYLTDPPRPSNGHYYGTGECFLWRASILPALPSDQGQPLSPQEEEDLLLANLPPPPSADTTNMQRWTTIGLPEALPTHHRHSLNASPPSESQARASRPSPSLNTQIAPIPVHQQPSLLDMSPDEEFGDFESFHDEEKQLPSTGHADSGGGGGGGGGGDRNGTSTNGTDNSALNVMAGHFSSTASYSNTNTAKAHHKAPPSPLANPINPTTTTTITSTTTTNDPIPVPETPSRLRFRAFPYSGINDYLIFCEPAFLSVGGGDGHYGLWLDSSLERGVSEHCPTFGNEGLSGEDSVPGAAAATAAPLRNGGGSGSWSGSGSGSGTVAPGPGAGSGLSSPRVAGAEQQRHATPTAGHGRFDVLGVEVWVVGA